MGCLNLLGCVRSLIKTVVGTFYFVPFVLKGRSWSGYAGHILLGNARSSWHSSSKTMVVMAYLFGCVWWSHRSIMTILWCSHPIRLCENLGVTHHQLLSEGSCHRWNSFGWELFGWALLGGSCQRGNFVGEVVCLWVVWFHVAILLTNLLVRVHWWIYFILENYSPLLMIKKQHAIVLVPFKWRFLLLICAITYLKIPRLLNICVLIDHSCIVVWYIHFNFVGALYMVNVFQ